MNTTILSFGKFKGQRVCDTPQWYQTWLTKQDWFTNQQPKKANNRVDSRSLRGWDGHSRKGQAIYDAVFEQEMSDSDKYDPSDRYGYYDGLDRFQ